MPETSVDPFVQTFDVESVETRKSADLVRSGNVFEADAATRHLVSENYQLYTSKYHACLVLGTYQLGSEHMSPGLAVPASRTHSFNGSGFRVLSSTSFRLRTLRLSTPTLRIVSSSNRRTEPFSSQTYIYAIAITRSNTARLTTNPTIKSLFLWSCGCTCVLS